MSLSSSLRSICRSSYRLLSRPACSCWSFSLASMAWRSSGSTNAALIENLARNGLIQSDAIRQAMLAVDRAHYAPSRPYEDTPQGIGYAATISAPHMHANAAESLLSYLQPSASNPAPRVLDVGSGSGYLTHVLANVVGEHGSVVGIDHIEPLVALSRANMGKSSQGQALLQTGRVRFVCGDGRRGWAEGGPYDAIHVGAAARVAHEELIDQLKNPGRLFIPVGEERGSQYIWIIDKDGHGTVTRDRKYGVMYVPLTDAPAVAAAKEEL